MIKKGLDTWVTVTVHYGDMETTMNLENVTLTLEQPTVEHYVGETLWLQREPHGPKRVSLTGEVIVKPDARLLSRKQPKRTARTYRKQPKRTPFINKHCLRGAHGPEVFIPLHRRRTTHQSLRCIEKQNDPFSLHQSLRYIEKQTMRYMKPLCLTDTTGGFYIPPTSTGFLPEDWKGFTTASGYNILDKP